MKGKISVFGSTGFIGTEFCRLFPGQVIEIGRESRVPKTSDILYLASTNHNYNVFSDVHLDINTNLNVLVDVLENCKENKDITFNFVSSWFVYGKTDDLPAKEDSYCNPKGFYSITKRTAEQLLVSYCETFGIKYRIIRLCNVYGSSDTKVSKKKNALQYLTGEITSGRDVNLYDGGENIRDFMHVEDVCRAMKLIIKESPTNDIINVGSGNPYKFIDIMSYVKDKTGSKSAFISVDPPEFHKVVQVQDMYLNVDKLKNLGFKPRYNIWDGLDVLINSTKEQKNEQ
tara:strand:+ start:930 stop:1787 length:858 start_codon:yes stop_codon:yes gene_type:complete